MSNDTKTIKVEITRDELFIMMMGLGDSITHWWNLQSKVREDGETHLTEHGCELVLKQRRKMYNKLSELYDQHNAEIEATIIAAPATPAQAA